MWRERARTSTVSDSWIDVSNDLRVTTGEEEPRLRGGGVADELEVGVPEAAGADAEGVRDAQVAAHFGTARERRCRGYDCGGGAIIAGGGSLRRCNCSSPSVRK